MKSESNTLESRTQKSEPTHRRFIGSSLGLILATRVTLSAIPFVRLGFPRSRGHF